MFSLTKSFAAISRLLRPAGDQLENLQLAPGDAQLSQLFLHSATNGAAAETRYFLTYHDFFFRVSLRPNQIPSPANSSAIKPP